MKQGLLFSLKVWLTAVMIGPFIYVSIDLLFHPQYYNGIKGQLAFIGYSIPYGLMLSVPSWLILLSTLVALVYSKFNVVIKKVVTSVVGAIFAYAPFYLLFHGDGHWFETFLWGGSYSLAIVAGIWIFNLEPKYSQPPIDN